MTSSSPPVIVLIPGGAHSPSHYAHLLHLLQTKGFPTLSALLPSVGTTDPVTIQDDTDFVRNRMLLPILDVQNRNVVLVTHSYGGLPGSAAARGLGKSDRQAQGKGTSVIGQIHISSMLVRGGDGKSMLDALGGKMAPGIDMDESKNLVSCSDPTPLLYHDLSPLQASTAAATVLIHALSTFTSPCPPCSWDTPAFKGRNAYIHCMDDRSIPVEGQKALLKGTGVEWNTREVQASHSAHVSKPEELVGRIVEVVGVFEGVGG